MLNFEWDKEKALSNTKKHGIDFSEATTIFSDQYEITITDPIHSVDEYRFISIGVSENKSLLVVSYTERHPDMIRIISARKASKKEFRYYEQNCRIQ